MLHTAIEQAVDGDAFAFDQTMRQIQTGKRVLKVDDMGTQNKEGDSIFSARSCHPDSARSCHPLPTPLPARSMYHS